MEAIAKIFKLLGDPNRLKILYALEKNPLSVSQIMECSSLSQPLVSFHLKVLREAGWVTPYREGTFVFNKLTHQEVIGLINSFEPYCDQETQTSTTPFTAARCCPPWMKS